MQNCEIMKKKIDHQIEKDGLLYKIVRTPEECQMVLDMFIDVMLEGK